VAEGSSAARRDEIRRVAIGVDAMAGMMPYVVAGESLTIPASLLPRDGRFGSGPSKVRQAQVDALCADAPTYLGTSHRQAPVRAVVQELREGLATLFSLPDGYEVLLGNGGTTTFWDAATFSLIEARSEHLSFGEFSSKFAAATAAAPHLLDPLVVASEPGTHPDVVPDATVDTYALTHNETSTGVMAPIARSRGVQGLVVVDATSAAGGLFVDAAEFDCYYFAPQKSFASDAGLWLALCSPAAIERIERLAASDRWIPPTLDLKIALDNSRLQQTYNTPALATLHLLRSQLRWMLEHGGLAFTAGRCERSAERLYGWAEASAFARPFVEKPAMRSRVVATVDLDEGIDALRVAGVLRHNGVVDTEPYRKLGRNQLRVAMFPSIDPEDVAALCACIDWVVDALH
jgi:phosphoserine aminotransferase